MTATGVTNEMRWDARRFRSCLRGTEQDESRKRPSMQLYIYIYSIRTATATPACGGGEENRGQQRRKLATLYRASNAMPLLLACR